MTTDENPADTVIEQAARAITAALADAGLLADPADRDELRSQLRRARQERDDERAAKEGNWKALGEWSARAERAEAEVVELRATIDRVRLLNAGWKSGQGNRHAYCINPESLRAALDGAGEQQ